MTSPGTLHVAAGLYRIPLGGGFVSAYLLETAGGLVLVDSGVPGSEEAILGAVAEAGHEPSGLATVLLTHAHLDHSGSAAAVREATGARILLSEPDADLIASGWSGRPTTIMPGMEDTIPLPPGVTLAELVTPVPIEAFAVDGHLEPGPVPGLVDVEAIAAPGHCAGQMAFLWNGVLLTGDALTNFPEQGLGIALVGEDLDVSARTAAELAAREFEIAAFGHGDPVVGGAARALRDALG
jgi:glyoxylase-like metal-dependent hydrolase (beta-lactamase superfamily II)